VIAAPTRWSLVSNAKHASPQGQAALSELCAIYHAAVSTWIKHRWQPAAEAEDLTQSFFAKLLRGDQLSAASPAQGSFRSYLFGAVRHFLLEQHRHRSALSRSAQHAELDEAIPDEGILSPDREFDRAWAIATLNQALQRLETEHADRPTWFLTLKPWLIGTADHGQTRALAQQLCISEVASRVAISRMRQRMRDIVQQILSETLVEGAAVEEEFLHLQAALR
jgi:RNA polymerase sigma factor (sigma-70 family)